MRILQLCKKIPLPPKDGEAIAIHQLTKQFASEGNDVSVLAMYTNKHDYIDPDTNNPSNAAYHFVSVNTSVSWWGALKNLLFSSLPYIVQRFDNQVFRAKLIDLLRKQEFDIIQLEGSFLGLYINTIRAHSKAKIVLRSHNIESQIWERISSEIKSKLKSLYLNNIMIPRFRKYEKEVFSRVDAIVPISDSDASFIQKQYPDKPGITIPVGYSLNPISKEKIPAPTFGFIGEMEWLPNKHGMDWFFTQVWLPFYKHNSAARFLLAGRNLTNQKKYNYPGVTVLGEVDDADAFIRTLTVLVVPIFSGSGIRVKIIESMSVGTPVLSTSVGAEGIKYISANNHPEKGNIFIANDARSFIEKMTMICKHPEYREIVAHNARKMIETHYESNQLARKLLAFYKNITTT